MGFQAGRSGNIDSFLAACGSHAQPPRTRLGFCTSISDRYNDLFALQAGHLAHDALVRRADLSMKTEGGQQVAFSSSSTTSSTSGLTLSRARVSNSSSRWSMTSTP